MIHNFSDLQRNKLYTNLPHGYGLEALSYWIDKHPGSLQERFNKQFFLESATLILKNNNRKFNDKFFVQINGTAIGTIFVSTYVTLSMGNFEMIFYTICINEFGNTLGHFILENWCRILDDCEAPLDKTHINRNRLLEILNYINPSIEFKMEANYKELLFLDIFIKRNNDKIWMDINFKVTDTRRCLPFLSRHPTHCKKNIPFTLARRICTIVENQN